MHVYKYIIHKLLGLEIGKSPNPMHHWHVPNQMTVCLSRKNAHWTTFTSGHQIYWSINMFPEWNCHRLNILVYIYITTIHMHMHMYTHNVQMHQMILLHNINTIVIKKNTWTNISMISHIYILYICIDPYIYIHIHNHWYIIFKYSINK